MGETLKLLQEGDLLEWLTGPNAGARARIICERRYFAAPLDGVAREVAVELQEEGMRCNRLGSRRR